MVAAVIGMVLAIGGALALYLASPHQRITARPLPGRTLGWGGIAALAGGLAALLQWAGPATAVFMAVTLAMLVWSVVPAAAAWLRRNESGGR